MTILRRVLLAVTLAVSTVLLGVPAHSVLAADGPAQVLDATTRDFDQVHIAVRVTPHIAEGTVDGEATLDFTSLADPLKVLRLHCRETEVLGARDRKGRALGFALAGDVLSVTLVDPLPRDAAESVTVAYRSRPTQGLFFHAPTKEAPHTPLEMYSQGEGEDNRRWFPCYDLPDDRLTCEVVARVPADLRTVGNGLLVGSRDAGGGLREDHWRLEQRIPTYLVSLVVGRFDTVAAKWRDIPLEYNGPPGRADEMATGCAGTPAMMEFFSEYTGMPYPYPRYAQTTVWDFVYGGMENASCTTMNMRLLHGKEVEPNYSGDGLVAHELAHMWFGDLLTCRTFEHLWLNEGFATYFTDLFFEHRDGPGEFALERRSGNRGYMDRNAEPSKQGLTPSRRGDVPLELFGGKQYDRGAAILHQLRIELGDGAFREGIRRYVRDNADRAVTSEDLRRSMESASGRDLRWFFQQWIYGSGYPALEVSWTARAGGGASITVEQVQAEGGGQPREFRLSLPVVLHGGAAPVAATLDLRARRQAFDVPAGWTPGFVRIGAGGGVFARIRLKQEAAAWIKALEADPDPAGRLDAVEALAEWPDAALPGLRSAAAGDSCWAVRRDAVAALGRIPGKASLDAMLAAAADKDSRVREAAAEALGGRTRDEAAAMLAAMAGNDSNPYVRSQAARSLGRVHAEGAFEVLSGLLSVESHRETIRQGALDGLAALGDPRALALARPLLAYDWPRGDHQGMREAALRLLLALDPDEPSTRAAVVKLCDDPFHRMRPFACEQAGNYAIREAEPVLRRLAEKDPFDSVKGAAKAALERIAPPKKK